MRISSEQMSPQAIEAYKARREQQMANRKALLKYQVGRQISASGDKMSMPGIALGGLAGAALGSRGRVGALGGAAIGGAAGFLGLRAAGRMDERGRMLKLAEEIKANQGRVGTTNLEANLKPALRELAARSERIVELAAASWVGPSGMNAKGQRPEDNWKRAAGMGLLIGGPQGAILAQPLAAQSDKKNVIYRKRDAALDSLKIALAGGGGQLLGSTLGKGIGPRASLPMALAGLAGGLYGGYRWAKSGNQERISEAESDKKKTRMAAAYLQGLKEAREKE